MDIWQDKNPETGKDGKKTDEGKPSTENPNPGHGDVTVTPKKQYHAAY